MGEWRRTQWRTVSGKKVRQEPGAATLRVVRHLVSAIFIEGSKVSAASAKGYSNRRRVMLGFCCDDNRTKRGERTSRGEGVVRLTPEEGRVASTVLMQVRAMIVRQIG
jgi:hypothetical protein